MRSLTLAALIALASPAWGDVVVDLESVARQLGGITKQTAAVLDRTLDGTGE
jgi:hypothetical protein